MRCAARASVVFKVKNPQKAKDLKNDDWLRDIEIEVKNTGTKPIYFLRFSLFFIDVEGNPGKRIGYPRSYGRFDMIKIDERARPEDVPIMPGETHVFRMPESYSRDWNLRRARENKPHPKKIGFIFHELNHGDGTGFLGTGGDPIPAKKSPRRGRPTTRAGRRLIAGRGTCIWSPHVERRTSRARQLETARVVFMQDHAGGLYCGPR